MRALIYRYMKFKVNLKYNSKDESTGAQQTTANFIIGAVHSKNEKGLDGDHRRIFGRIQDKLDDAIDNKLEYIDLERAEYDLIVRALKEARLPAIMSSNLVILEDELEDCLKRDKAKDDKKGKKED